MQRIVINETKGLYTARIQSGFLCFWRTTSKTPQFDTLPGLLSDLAVLCAGVLRQKYGSKFTRQHTRALGRKMGKLIG